MPRLKHYNDCYFISTVKQKKRIKSDSKLEEKLKANHHRMHPQMHVCIYIRTHTKMDEQSENIMPLAPSTVLMDRNTNMTAKPSN